MLEKMVCGFMISSVTPQVPQCVMLIEKNRPEWQKGRLNGIGGHIEKGETSQQAMSREFHEETAAQSDGWDLFAILTNGRTWCVDFLFCVVPGFPTYRRQCNEGIIGIYPIKDLPDNVLPNLRWLIPMALSFGHGETAKYFSIKERI
jgi:8-oxo-dGTP diphosphatase